MGLALSLAMRQVLVCPGVSRTGPSIGSRSGARQIRLRTTIRNAGET